MKIEKGFIFLFLSMVNVTRITTCMSTTQNISNFANEKNTRG